MGFRQSIRKTLGSIVTREIARRQKRRYAKVASRLYKVAKSEALSG